MEIWLEIQNTYNITHSIWWPEVIQNYYGMSRVWMTSQKVVIIVIIVMLRGCDAMVLFVWENRKNSPKPYTVQPIKFSELMLSDTLLYTSQPYLAFPGKRRNLLNSRENSLERTVLVSPPVVNWLQKVYMDKYKWNCQLQLRTTRGHPIAEQFLTKSDQRLVSEGLVVKGWGWLWVLLPKVVSIRKILWAVLYYLTDACAKFSQ